VIAQYLLVRLRLNAIPGNERLRVRHPRLRATERTVKNAKIPQDRDPKSLTPEECQALLAVAPARGTNRWVARRPRRRPPEDEEMSIGTPSTSVVIAYLRDGAVFEQAGINFSHVMGGKLPASATAQRPEPEGASFEATDAST
jgi:hypothetical protein